MVKYLIKIFIKNVYWKVYSRTISNPKLPSQIKSILFVCKGNICRSPFAEHLSSKHFSKSNQLLFSSAGIQVDHPIPPPKEAIFSATNFGIELRDHKSRQINCKLMESYDMITVMETWQYTYLKKKYRKFKNKIFLLPLFEKSPRMSLGSYYIHNIKDPYGKNIIEYDECYNRIENCIAGLFSTINGDMESPF